MQIVTRADWGARPPKWRRTIPLPSPELWLHHSVSASGGASRIRGIQNFHMDERGWPDIAYTFLINADGLIFEGVPPGFQGTHTAGHNTSGHGICLLGNFNTIQPSQEALDALIALVRWGHGQGWWPLGLTGGHRDTRGGAKGDCPGDRLYDQLPQINALIRQGGPSIQGDDDMSLVARMMVVEAGAKTWLPTQEAIDHWMLRADNLDNTEYAAEWRRDFEQMWAREKQKEYLRLVGHPHGAPSTGTTDPTARAAAAGAKARADTAHDRLDRLRTI